MPTVSIHTLGCKLNFAESGTLTREFRSRGFEPVEWGDAADVAVINTCTVTAEAERKCRQAIRKALRGNPDTFIVVTGCYAQLRPEQIAEIDGVDAVLGNAEKFDLFGLIDSFEKREATQVDVSCIADVRAFGAAFAAGERTRAFLKIQDGCDYSCSFCTIPAARGPSRSHTIEGAVTDARNIADDGFREIVLSGVNIGLFGQDTDESLLDLLVRLDEIDGIDRYRISSIEPNLLTDRIIEFVASSRAFQPHFHIPLQSGNDEILGFMRRRYRRDVHADRVERIRSLLPAACIGADVIVGFPGETEAHFQDTVHFLDDLDVSYLHAFTYSERPGTMASREAGAVPGPERSRRNRVLRVLSEKKRRSHESAHLGTVRPVLWEDERDESSMWGFTDNYIRVRRTSDRERVGTIENVLLARPAASGAVEGLDPGLRVLQI
jgi:threonylcarbamoyladenosine tRNA methylthiotransferase MtaB